MAMTRLEKRFVNRQRKARLNIEKLRARLNDMELDGVRDALELGCGIGTVSSFLAEEYGIRVVGTDFDPEQIEVARSLYDEGDLLTFRVEDGSNLTFPDENFDLVVSQNVFHHIPRWDKAVEEVVRVLRSGGYFIWLDLAFPALLKRLLAPMVKNYGLYTFREISDEFERNGLLPTYYERMFHGFFMHHHLVLRKGPSAGL